MSVDLLIDVLIHWQMQNDLQTYTPPLYKCLSLRESGISSVVLR